ncbi:MAG TPA: hypothetical protein VF535_14165 [Allosphingosinicella sp.]
MHNGFADQDPLAEILTVRQCAAARAGREPALAKSFRAPIGRTEAFFDAPVAEPEVSPVSPRKIAALRSAARGVHWGRDPHDALPPDPANWATYSPRYIVILYVRLNQNWDMSVNHACFTPTVNTPEGRLAQAIRILDDKIKYDCDLGDSRLHQYGIYEHIYKYPDAGHQLGRDYDSFTFSDFKFYNQNELFIFIHDPDITIQDGDLLAFKAAGLQPKPMDFNFSYFNARAVDPAEMSASLAQEGRMMRVENYATKEDGTPIGNDNRNYSIDIKFRIDAGPAGMITMIIDPDTGNGAGNEP